MATWDSQNTVCKDSYYPYQKETTCFVNMKSETGHIRIFCSDIQNHLIAFWIRQIGRKFYIGSVNPLWKCEKVHVLEVSERPYITSSDPHINFEYQWKQIRLFILFLLFLPGHWIHFIFVCMLNQLSNLSSI